MSDRNCCFISCICMRRQEDAGVERVKLNHYSYACCKHCQQQIHSGSQSANFQGHKVSSDLSHADSFLCGLLHVPCVWMETLWFAFYHGRRVFLWKAAGRDRSHSKQLNIHLTGWKCETQFIRDKETPAEGRCQSEMWDTSSSRRSSIWVDEAGHTGSDLFVDRIQQTASSQSSKEGRGKWSKGRILIQL